MFLLISRQALLQARPGLTEDLGRWRKDGATKKNSPRARPARSRPGEQSAPRLARAPEATGGLQLLFVVGQMPLERAQYNQDTRKAIPTRRVPDRGHRRERRLDAFRIAIYRRMYCSMQRRRTVA